jgi:alkaline phosphatase
MRAIADMDVTAFVSEMAGIGLPGILVLTLLEKLIPVLPSYVLLVGIGMAHAVDPDMLPPVIAAATVGSTLGSLVWYGIGRAFGEMRTSMLVQRWGHWLFLSPSLYQRLTSAFARHQFRIALVGQTIPTVRIYLALPAWVMALPIATFGVATFIGTILWNAPLITIGWWVRDSGYDRISVGLVVVAVIIVIEAVVLVAARLRYLQLHRRSSRSV